MAEINKPSWISSNSFEFAFLTFNHVYTYIGNRLKLEPKLLIEYWQQFAKAQAEFVKHAHFHDTDKMANKFFNLLPNHISKKLLPLPLIQEVKRNTPTKLEIPKAYQKNEPKIKTQQRSQNLKTHASKCYWCTNPTKKCKWPQHLEWWKRRNNTKTKKGGKKF